MCYGLTAYLRICQSGRRFAGYVGIANFRRWAETLGAFLRLSPKEASWDRKQRAALR